MTEEIEIINETVGGDSDVEKTVEALHRDRWEQVKKAQKKGKKRVLNGNFIFDDDEVMQRRPFTQCRINNGLFGFGLLLPKEVPLTDKRGQIVGTDQVWKPALITHDGNLFEVTKEFELEHKIKIDSIPGDMSLRWPLKRIKGFLDGNAHNVDPKKLFDRITGCYTKFMFYHNDVWYDVHSLWDLGTYFFMLFHAYPIFEMRGLQGTAKTKSMMVSQKIALNATEIMINPSEATLFRETHDKRPSKYIDEAEKLFMYNKASGNVEPDKRAELINASYLKGGSVPRQEKIGNKFVTVYYNCYSPTQISSIKGLYGATESRAITHIHTKAPDNDKRGEMEVEDYANDPVWEEIRSDCYLFALQNWALVEESYLNFKEETGIKKRDMQLWKPLLVLAKIIDPGLYDRVKDFAVKVSKQRVADYIPEDTFDFKILEIVAEFIGEGKTRIYLNDIQDRYKELNPDVTVTSGFNRRVSKRLDTLGFKEFRDKDRNGSFFEIGKRIFDSIIEPICPYLSSQSSHSSQQHTVQHTLSDESDEVTN